MAAGCTAAAAGTVPWWVVVVALTVGFGPQFRATAETISELPGSGGTPTARATSTRAAAGAREPGSTRARTGLRDLHRPTSAPKPATTSSTPLAIMTMPPHITAVSDPGTGHATRPPRPLPRAENSDLLGSGSFSAPGQRGGSGRRYCANGVPRLGPHDSRLS